MRQLGRFVYACRMPTPLVFLLLAAAPANHWATSWTASMHGPYPSGNASAQPDLRLVFPNATARDQTFRMIVRPDIITGRSRLRFSNAFGTRPVTLDGVFAGVHLGGGALLRGTNRPVRFNGGKTSVTIEPGATIWSDAILLKPQPEGRKLAISFHIAGDSGPMTWHAKALTTSYVTAPGAGAKGDQESETAFPFTTTSWYFLDAVDMMAAADTKVIVAFGDSITDGTASTLNGDDRWPDALSRRLHAKPGSHISVVNAGIGGNRVVGPTEYSPIKPVPGGPSAIQRLDRDVLTLSGVTTVIWLEGINDFSVNANESVDAVIAVMKDVVKRLRARLPNVRIIGATVVSALGSTNAAHGSSAEDAKRKALNDFIRHSNGVFDGFADFDAATLDPNTGGLRAEFVPDSTTGGPGDKLHPNRAGYLAMAAVLEDFFRH